MRKTSIVVACAALAASPAIARAGADPDAAAVRKVIEAQAKVIGQVPPDGTPFAATLARDAFAILPGGYVVDGAKAADAILGGWGDSGGYGITGAKLGKVVIGHTGDVAWVTADLTFSATGMDGKQPPVPVRATELLTRDGATWKVRALQWSRPIKDEPEMWANFLYDDQFPDAAAQAPLAKWLGKTTDLAAHLRAGADVVVLGSAKGERGEGAKAAALLKSWGKLTFTVEMARQGGDGKTYAWFAAKVTRKAKVKEWGELSIPYWGLFLAVKGAKDWEIVSAHYAQDMPQTDESDPCGGE